MLRRRSPCLWKLRPNQNVSEQLSNEALLKIEGELQTQTSVNFLGRTLRHNGGSVDIMMSTMYVKKRWKHMVRKTQKPVSTTGSITKPALRAQPATANNIERLLERYCGLRWSDLTCRMPLRKSHIFDCANHYIQVLAQIHCCYSGPLSTTVSCQTQTLKWTLTAMLTPVGKPQQRRTACEEPVWPSTENAIVWSDIYTCSCRWSRRVVTESSLVQCLLHSSNGTMRLLPVLEAPTLIPPSWFTVSGTSAVQVRHIAEF